MPDRPAILKGMRKWLADPFNKSFMYEKRVEEVEGVLAKGTGVSNRERSLVGHALRSLGTWRMTRGGALLADGDSEGWAELSRGLLAEYWHIRLLVEGWAADTRRNKQARMDMLPVSLALAMARGMGVREVSSWMGEQLVCSVDDGSLGLWGDSHFPIFMLRLQLRDTGRDDRVNIPMVIDDPDPYASVFDAWSDPDGLAQAILAMCDFHMSRNEDNTDEYIAEFGQGPFDILPVEVWALRAVRDAQGLPTPEVSHPLLEPPYDRPPADPPKVNDPLLDRVRIFAEATRDKA